MSNYDSTNRARRITNKTLSEPSFIFFSLSLALSIRVFCVTIREMDSGRTRCLRDSMYIYFVFFDIAELNWRRYLGGFHWAGEECILYVFSSCIFIKEGWFWYGVNDSFELFYMQFKLIETLLKFKFIVFPKFEFQTSSRKFLSPKRKINPLYTSFHYSFTLFAHSRGRIHRGWSKCKTI